MPGRGEVGHDFDWCITDKHTHRLTTVPLTHALRVNRCVNLRKQIFLIKNFGDFFAIRHKDTMQRIGSESILALRCVRRVSMRRRRNVTYGIVSRPVHNVTQGLALR